MIRLENIHKDFGTQSVLKGISMEIKKGERLCIIGRSGSGKTTLLNIIMGLQKPDVGTVNSENVRFSCVFQEDRLVPQLSAYKNIALATRALDIYEKAAQIDITKDLLLKKVADLSGGERRRVAILRALLATSDIIVLDEAAKGLDEATGQKVIKLILDNLNGRALIAVTHNKLEADAIGGTLLILK